MWGFTIPVTTARGLVAVAARILVAVAARVLVAVATRDLRVITAAILPRLIIGRLRSLGALVGRRLDDVCRRVVVASASGKGGHDGNGKCQFGIHRFPLYCVLERSVFYMRIYFICVGISFENIMLNFCLYQYAMIFSAICRRLSAMAA